MELFLPSILGYELVARDAVAALAHRVGIDGARVEDLKTALCEACTNAIEHGNAFEPERCFAVRCWLDASHLVIEVCDDGVKVPSDVPLFASVSSSLTRGLGLMLMRRLSDASHISSSVDGTCVRLAFRYPDDVGTFHATACLALDQESA